MTKSDIGKIVMLSENIRKRMERTMIPKDPVMLLSYMNTQLRDFYSSLDAFCEDKNADRKELEEKLAAIDYVYDPAANQFV